MLTCTLLEPSHSPQAAATAAAGLAAGLRAAVAPLDVFAGSWLLDLLFWGVLLGISFTVLVQGPKQ